MELIGLGLSVDSTGVKKGVDELNKLGRSGTQAEQALNKTTGAANSQGRALNRLNPITRAVRQGNERLTRSVHNLGNGFTRARATAVGLSALLSTLATGALVQFIRSSLNAVDAQAKLARQLDSTMGGLRALQLAASDAGVSTDVINSAMERFSARLGEAQRGTGQAAEALDRLNLSANDLSEMDVDERVATIADRVRELGLTGAQTADVLRQFGIRNREIVNLMRQGGTAIRDARQEVEDYGLAVDNIDARSIEAANDAFSRVALVVESVKNAVAVDLSPIILQLAKDFNSSAREAGGWGDVATQAIRQIIGSISPLLDAYQMVDIALNRVMLLSKQAGVIIRTSMLDAATAIMEGPARAVNSMIEAFNRIPMIAEIPTLAQPDWVEGLGNAASSAAMEVQDLQGQLDELNNRPKPSENIAEFFERVDETAQSLRDSVDDVDEGNRALTGTFQTLDEWLFETNDSLNTLTTSTTEQASASNALDKRLNSLLNTLSPSRQRTQQYAQTVNLLNTALASGRITFGEYQTAMIAAQDAMADTEDASNELADTVEADADLMTDATEGFLDAFERGAIESFDDVGDYFTDLLGDMVRAAAANEIRMSLGMDTSGMMSGGFGDITGGQQGSMPKGGGTLINAGRDAYAGYMGTYGSSLGVQGGVSGTAIGSANAVANGTGVSGAYSAGTGSMAGNAMGGLYTAGAGYAGGYAGTEFGSAISGKEANSNVGATIGTTAGAYVGSIVPVIGTYLGAAIGGFLGGTLDSLFGSGGWETKDTGIQLGVNDGGLQANNYERQRKSGGLFSGSSYRINESEMESEVEKALQVTYQSQENALRTIVDTLEMQQSALGGFETEMTRIDTRNMSGDEIEVAIQDWMSGVMDGAAFDAVASLDGRISEIVEGMEWSSDLSKMESELEDTGKKLSESARKKMVEGAADVLRTAGEIKVLENIGNELGGAVTDDIYAHFENLIETGEQTVKEALKGLTPAVESTVFLANSAERLNFQFDETANGAIHAAFSLRETVGGLENLSSMQSSYYQNYFTEAERAANLQDDLTESFAEMGMQLPETREGFRQLVEAQDLNTEAGRENYATLLQLAGSFSELISATQGATNAVEDSADAQRERAKLERDLLKLQGDTDDLRRRELESLDQSNRGLQSHIYLYDDATSAMDALGDSVDKRVSELNSAMNAEIDMARAGYEQRIEAAEEAFNEEQRFNEKRIESTRESISELSSLTQMLSRAAGRASVDTPALSMSRRQRGRSFVANAAQSGGLPDAGQLESALNFAGGDAEQFYSSFDEYMKDQLETQAHIRDLEQRAEGQLSTEEAALEALLNQNEAAELQHRESINQMQRDSENTVDALREQYAAQIAQIEQQQINAERQYNAIRGVDDSVRSVGSAVRAVESAISAVAAANSESAGSMSVGAFANGGNHAGGWRVVGERGPELEWTPPSRIMSNQSSTSQLNTEAVRQAVDMMRVEMSGALSGILTSTRETASLLDDWDAIGQPAVRSVDA